MKHFKGTWRLILLALRRDRVKLSVAILSVSILMTMFVAGVTEVFDTEEDMRQGIAFLSANPGMRLFGLPTGDEFGHLLMLRIFTFIGIIIALINTFAVIRHTRQNEELGRFELVGSGVVGRYAGLTAALLVTLAANILMTILIYFGLLINNLPSQGAFLMAISFGAVGISFSCLAAIFAQFTQTSRGANGWAAGSVGIAFLLSGIGSVLGELKESGVEVIPAWPTYITPFGWAQMLKPFAEENWWFLIVFVIFWVVCIGLALFLSGKRDIGQGLFAARAGRAAAPSWLLNMAGFTWRLNRGVFISWTVGIMLLGAIYGVIAGDAEELLSQAEGIAKIFISATGSEEIMLAFFGSILSVLGVFALAYAVQVTLRLRAEETRALEFLLSNKLSRVKWLLFQVGFVVVSVSIILFLAGLSAALTATVTLEETENIIWPVIAGALVQLPAILLLVGFVVALFGLLPRLATTLAWVAVAVSVVLGPFFGALLNLPDKILNISPLTHTPIVPPLEDVDMMPLIIMLGIAMIFICIGTVTFRRRDLKNA